MDDEFVVKIFASGSTFVRSKWVTLCLFLHVTAHIGLPCESHAQPSVQSVLEQIDFERQKIVSGRFSCEFSQREGRQDRTDDSEPELDQRASWNAECTFDWAARSAVMGVTYEAYDDSLPDSKYVQAGSRYVSAWVGDDFWFTNLEKTPLWLVVNDKGVPQSVPSYGMTPIDPRAVGLAPPSRLLEGFRLSESLVAVDLNSLSTANRLKPTPLEVHPSDDGKYLELSQVYHRGIIRRTIVVDPNSAYVVRRLLVEEGSSDLESGVFEPKRFSYTCDVEWKEHGDIWVPDRVFTNHYEAELADGVLEGKVPADAPGSVFVKTSRKEFEFEWSAINEPVKPEIFRYENFGLPVGTLVADFRLPEPEIVDRIASDSSVSQPTTSLGRVFMFLVVACLGVGAFCLFQRRSGRPKTR